MKELKKEEQAYGCWICAPPFVKGRSLVIKVLGFYEARKKERQPTFRMEPTPIPVAVLDLKESLMVVQSQSKVG